MNPKARNEDKLQRPQRHRQPRQRRIKMLSKLFQWLRSSSCTHVVHFQDGDCHAVLVGALRVLVCEEEPGIWSAQGIDIDFAASGTSVDDVQIRFEYGLSNTLRNPIDRFGGIEKLLRFAPQNVWVDLVGNAKQYNLNLIRVHEIQQDPLPYGMIAYYGDTAKAA